MLIWAGCACPTISLAHSGFLGAHRRRCPRAFVDVHVTEGGPGLRLPLQPKAIDKRNPDLARIQIFNSDHVLDGTVVRPGSPFPGHAKFRRRRFVNERDSPSVAARCVLVEPPFDRDLFSVNLNALNRRSHAAIRPAFAVLYLQINEARPARGILETKPCVRCSQPAYFLCASRICGDDRAQGKWCCQRGGTHDGFNRQISPWLELWLLRPLPLG